MMKKNLTEFKKTIKTNMAITMNIKTTIKEIETLIDAEKMTIGKITNARNKMIGNGIDANADVQTVVLVINMTTALAIMTTIAHAIMTTIALVIVLAKTAITTAV